MYCTQAKSEKSEWRVLSVDGGRVVGWVRLPKGIPGDVQLVDERFELVKFGEVPIPLMKLTTLDGVVVVELETVQKSSTLEMLLLRDGCSIPIPFSKVATMRAIDLMLGDLVMEDEVSADVVSYFLPGETLPRQYLRSAPTKEEAEALCKENGWTTILEMAAKWYESSGNHNHHLYSLAGVGPLMRLLVTEEVVPLKELRKSRIIDTDEDALIFLRYHSKRLGIDSVASSLIIALRRIVKSKEMTKALALKYYEWFTMKWPTRAYTSYNTSLLLVFDEGWKMANKNLLETIKYLI